MGDKDDIDVEGLRVDPERLHKPEAVPSGWRRVMTQVPRQWELKLLKASRISTYRLAHELLYLGWYSKGEPIAVTSQVAKATGLSVRSKWRALRELEQLGLIKIVSGSRKSPRVTLLHSVGRKP